MLSKYQAGIESVSETVFQSATDVAIDLDGRYICLGFIDCHNYINAVAEADSLDGSAFGFDLAILYFRQPFLCKQMLRRVSTTTRDSGGGTLPERSSAVYLDRGYVDVLMPQAPITVSLGIPNLLLAQFA
ncbi:hypothetical protein G7046_g2618 [Stylonectria norvegica]|nr:hypothetical protein G7046_g2618 [Stylonectria norvegica]